MLDWLIGKGIGWVFSLLALAIIWPIYKSGFLVRQGLTYQRELNQFDRMLRSRSTQLGGATLTPTAEYYTIKRKALAFMILPSLGLLTLFVILLIVGGWKIAAIELALAVVGFFNVS